MENHRVSAEYPNFKDIFRGNFGYNLKGSLSNSSHLRQYFRSHHLLSGSHKISHIVYLFWQNFSLDPFEEDVFEAMSCYFPIDFSPPRGGSLEITKEDLVLGLRNCLSASELFAPLAMPLFIEKLDSDLQVKFALFTN